MQLTWERTEVTALYVYSLCECYVEICEGLVFDNGKINMPLNFKKAIFA